MGKAKYVYSALGINKKRAKEIQEYIINKIKDEAPLVSDLLMEVANKEEFSREERIYAIYCVGHIVSTFETFMGL